MPVIQNWWLKPLSHIHIAVAEIVGYGDEDDIGTLLGWRGNSCECQGSEACCEQVAYWSHQFVLG